MTDDQRETLRDMAFYADHFAEVAGQRRDERSVMHYRRRADALRAALGTCGTCRHGDTSQTDADWCFCAAPSTEPTRYPCLFARMRKDQRCTGWTAK